MIIMRGFQAVLCGLCAALRGRPGQEGRSGIIRVAADWQAWSACLAPLAAPGSPRGCRPCCRAAAAPPPRGRSELIRKGRYSRPARVGGTVRWSRAHVLCTLQETLPHPARALATQGLVELVARVWRTLCRGDKERERDREIE
jgi:hypothetical protein